MELFGNKGLWSAKANFLLSFFFREPDIYWDTCGSPVIKCLCLFFFLSCFRRSVVKAKRNGERRHSGEELKNRGGLGWGGISTTCPKPPHPPLNSAVCTVFRFTQCTPRKGYLLLVRVAWWVESLLRNTYIFCCCWSPFSHFFQGNQECWHTSVWSPQFWRIDLESLLS